MVFSKSLCALATLAVIGLSSAVLADDASTTVHFSGSGIGAALTEVHDDVDPFKGSATIMAYNDGEEAWTDFHFQIFSVAGSDVSMTDFVDGGAYNPTMTPSRPFTWVIDNAPVSGSTMDLYFAANPVNPGDMVTIKIYTDNTAKKVRFGLSMYPTVPEPVSMGLLGVGALLAVRRR